METKISQKVLSEIILDVPTGIFLFNIDWSLIFVNAMGLTDLAASFNELEKDRWLNWLIQKNSRLNLKLLKRFLSNHWSNPVMNRKIKIFINDDFYQTFLISIKIICIDGVEYRVMISRETTAENERWVRAIEFYKSFRRDLKIAKTIQKKINNSIINKIVGKDYIFHFYSVFMPSDNLSGDLINITQIDRNFSSIFLGDGKGHGLPAALYSPLIYSYVNILASKVLSGEHNLENIIHLINRQAYKDFVRDGEFYFFSGIFLLINGSNNKFSIVNAGHPPAFYLDSNKKIRRLTTCGPILGVFEEATYEKKEFEAEDGQIFFFYTDGLVENCRINDQITSTKKVFRFFAEYTKKYLSIDKFHDEIINSKLGVGNNNKIQDDISILVMKVEAK